MTPKKPKVQKTPAFVAIWWKDITGDSGWASEKEALDMNCAECFNVGVLIKRSKGNTYIASSFTDDGDYGNRDVIPNSVIKKMIKVPMEDFMQFIEGYHKKVK